MQVKKFEAPTLQEALEHVKRELGPEAIILQTKQNKRGFGLMSRGSVEVTAAVSERSLQKKKYVEDRVAPPSRDALQKMSAEKQAQIYEKYDKRAEAIQPERNASASSQRRLGASAGAAGGELAGHLDGDSHLTRALQRTASQDRVEVGRASAGAGASASASAGAAMARQNAQASAPSRGLGAGRAANQGAAVRPSGAQKITATRYIDIDDEESNSPATRGNQARSAVRARSQAPGEAELGAAIERMNERGTLGDMSLEQELFHLKRMIGELQSAQQEQTASGVGADFLDQPALRDVFDQLTMAGVERRLALGLVKKASFELGPDKSNHPELLADQIAVEIMQSVRVASPWSFLPAPSQVPAEGAPRQSGPAVVALVGPTGVGKTTTVAKMASEALLKRNLKVGLVNLDSYKVAAFDQLGTYAKILNIPFRSAGSGPELSAAIRDFGSLDLVLIDTTGRSQRDPQSLQAMKTVLQAVPEVKTELVLAVTTRDQELYDMAGRFAMFRPEGLILSKLDEATLYGAIYNVGQKVNLPLVYFTTGQRVPEDIEEATPERIAALIMDI